MVSPIVLHRFPARIATRGRGIRSFRLCSAILGKNLPERD
jgi:hypothetical protein